MGLSREYLIKKLDEPFVQAYHNYQVELAVLFGAERARAESEMKDVLDFEIELAEVRKLFNLILTSKKTYAKFIFGKFSDFIGS